MLRLRVECDGPGCDGALEVEAVTGDLINLEVLMDDWLVVEDKNSKGEQPAQRHYCSYKCLTAWAMAQQLMAG